MRRVNALKVNSSEIHFISRFFLLLLFGSSLKFIISAFIFNEISQILFIATSRTCKHFGGECCGFGYRKLKFSDFKMNFKKCLHFVRRSIESWKVKILQLKCLNIYMTRWNLPRAHIANVPPLCIHAIAISID